ncbi:unnamed protein product [Cyclocybe aegerita]|uniref:Uncharacterized protein n=1 Tax=Cyclocybe aegerita TaxID=1973307 RepID=A0A8S0WZV7_CYCAE|nr:unnamed protein product [Cyclocybe aegerita]
MASTSLWGRLVDIGYLILLKEEWRWEILRRTGTALLHVKATRGGHGATFSRLLGDILDAFWERIEILEVSAYFRSTYEGDLWDPLARPSEVLKIFRVSLGDLEHPLQAEKTLFGNDAPNLRELQLIGTAYLRTNIDLSSSWFSQLYHLDVSGSIFMPRPTLLEWLERLGGMPQLKTLSLSSIFQPVSEDPMPLPVIQLPNLTDLQVKHDIYSSALLLHHIETPPGCRLRVITSEIVTSISYPARSRFIGEVLSKYSKRWFSANTKLTNLTLDIKPHSFSVSQSEQNSSGSRGPGGQARTKFEVCIDVDYSVAFTELLPYVNELFQCVFSHITMVAMHLHLSPETGYTDSSHLRNLIANFVHALPEVRVLNTTMQAVAHLTKLPRGAGIPPPFPNLQVLKLYDAAVFGTAGRIDHGRGIGETFFRLRQEEKCPIQVLDLTSCSTLHDMSYLERAEGMKVSWTDDEGNRREEVCGYGGSLRLRKSRRRTQSLKSEFRCEEMGVGDEK